MATPDPSELLGKLLKDLEHLEELYTRDARKDRPKERANESLRLAHDEPLSRSVRHAMDAARRLTFEELRHLDLELHHLLGTGGRRRDDDSDSPFLEAALQASHSLSTPNLRQLDAFVHERLDQERKHTETLVLEYVRCGKARCPCRQGRKHGPYLYGYRWMGGKRRKRYLGKPNLAPKSQSSPST